MVRSAYPKFLRGVLSPQSFGNTKNKSLLADFVRMQAFDSYLNSSSVTYRFTNTLQTVAGVIPN